MAKLGHPTGKSILQGEYDTAPSEQGQSPNSGKRYHTFFQGHLGPVHSATLSPLGILICLLQQIQPTVCLWRTELNANLVCYKGHNYPVWDVQSCGTLFGQCFT